MSPGSRFQGAVADRLASGVQVGGWVVDWCLGEGGMGVVYRCHRSGDPGRARALKVVHAGLDARFVAELDALRSLDHPGIVGLIDSGVERGESWLVMELARGRPLTALRVRPPITAEVGLGLAQQLADALAHAHARGVFHRDVRPSNVLVDADGTAVLVDFGIATRSQHQASAAGQRAATPRYAPPEWFAAAPPDHAASDVYALGVVMWELATGELAFDGVTADALAAHKAEPLDAPSLPLAARALVRAMTRAEAAERPDAGAVAEALAPWKTMRVSRPAPTLPVLPPDPTPLPRQLGRYEVRGEIGRGGMGVVFDGWDPALSRAVALKWLPVLPGDASRHEARFRREVEILANLDHPGIVRVLDVGHHEGRLFYAMDRVAGPDLQALIAERGLVEPDRAVDWVVQVAGALASAHAGGVVHRDVKPSNVLLDGTGRALLADFGLALEQSRDTRLTRMGQILGTPAYMAPEQAAGSQVGPAADQFALGVVLYELVTGRTPTEGEHPDQIAAQYRRGVPRADEVTLAVPAELARVCARCLAANPADRYPSMEALIADLGAVRRGGRAWRPGPGRWLARVLRGRGTVMGLVLALAAFGVGGAGLAATWSRVGVGVDEVAASSRLAAVRRVIETRRSAGDDPGALAAFRGFVDLPENRTTRALAQAWLDRVAWARGEGDTDALTGALAQAWVTARHPDEDVAALRALADLLVSRGDWRPLTSVVAALEARGADGLGPLHDTLRAAGRSFDAVEEPALRALLGHLSLGTRLARGPTVAIGNADVDGDGKAETLVIHARRLQVAQAGDVGLERLVPLDLGVDPVAAAVLVEVPGAGPGVVVGDKHSIAVFDLGGKAPVLRDQWEDAAIGGATAIDLDGNGLGEVVVGTRYPTRHLIAVGQRVDGTWRRFDPLPPSDAANSGTTILRAGDFDGDGRDELLQARTAFGGYDLRLIRPGPTPRVEGRLRVGDQRPGTVLRGRSHLRPVVMRGDMWPSRQVFPPQAPFGPLPAGIHVLDWSGQGFVVTWSLTPPLSCTSAQAADLDGDGLDELLTRCHDDLVVSRQLEDGSLAPAWIHGLTTHGRADLDGDGDQEVVAYDDTDKQWWVLGAGTERLPEVGWPEPVVVGRRPEPASRIEDLVTLGLGTEASSRFVRLAEQVAEPAEAARLLERAAELQPANEPTVAADLFERSARAGNAQAWDRAAAALELAVALPESRAIAEHGLADPAVTGAARTALEARARRLGRLLDGPRVERDLSQGLEGWSIVAPLQASLDPGPGTLELRAIGERELARVPLRWDGGDLFIDVDMVLHRVEWGSNLELRVESDDPEGQVWAMRLSGMGGGGLLKVQAACVGPTGTVGKETIAIDQEDLELPVRLRLVRDATELRCAVTGLPRASLERGRSVPARPGNWALVVRSTSPGLTSMVSASIRSVVIHGASAAPWEAWGPDHLAAQRPERALEDLVTAEGPEVELWRVQALEQLGEEVEADRAFSHWAHRVGPQGVLAMAPVLLRSASPRMVARLAGALQDRLPEAWLATWEIQISQQSDSALLQRAMTAYPGILEDPGPKVPKLRAAVQELLTARGRAWRAEGATARAESDLRLAVALADAGAGDGVRARRELAAVFVARGDPDKALDLLEQALDGAGAPDVVADGFLVAPELRGLHDQPRWRAIRSAALR